MGRPLQRFVSACVLVAAICAAGLAGTASGSSGKAAAPTSLSGIKSYLLGRSQTLVGELAASRARAERYYALAKTSGFDYGELWQQHGPAVSRLLLASKPSFDRAHRAYEEEEGIIAGVPSLAQFDVIMDSGTSSADDPKTAVPFDLRLPDGRVFKRPGNYFHALLEPTLYGTDPRFVAKGQEKVDLDGDGKVEFGEVLPDANALVAIMRGFEQSARQSAKAAAGWKPTNSDVLTALVVMVPTMEGYFGEWKGSRFILGNKASERAFVSHSRLIDVHGILFSLQTVYAGIKPELNRAGAAQSAQIGSQLRSLTAFVDSIYAKEEAGKRFKPAEADLLGGQAQKQANAIAGQVSQAAGVLGIKLQA